MRSTLLRVFVGLNLAVILGCGLSNAGNDPPPPPTTTPGPTPVVIAPGPGGNGTQVTVDGRNTWPPSGPGCDRYVACCDAAATVSSSAQLMCQLTVAGDNFDCTRDIDVIRSYLRETGTALPPACAP